MMGEATKDTGGSYASVIGLALYYEVHGSGRPLVLHFTARPLDAIEDATIPAGGVRDPEKYPRRYTFYIINGRMVRRSPPRQKRIGTRTLREPRCEGVQQMQQQEEYEDVR
jgi:hypothetical protein